jgi:hypothetical protein
LSDDKKRKIYDQYGKEGADAADQMSEEQASQHFQGGGGGIRFAPGGGGGMHHHGGGMSPQEAEAFFSSFFGHSDPFGGAGGFGPRMSGGQRGGDPMSMLFGMGGPQMGGSMRGMGQPGVGGFGPAGMGQNFAGQRQQSPPQEKRYEAIPNGTIVSLVNLVGQADRNGDRGKVVGYDISTHRYTVEMEDSDGEYLRVKPSNILQHVHVTIQNLESKPELNGKQGTVIRFDEHSGRYNIYVMDLSKTLSLKPMNVILTDGTVAMITGLQSKPLLNGRYGTIKGWVKDSNRYDVQLSENNIVRVKTENARV